MSFSFPSNFEITWGELSKQIPTIQTDFFEKAFENWLINLLAVLVYVIGLIGIAGLLFVIWFERSGLAGPFRTLINQLVSFNLDQFVTYYIICNGLDLLRVLIGPLPMGICRLNIFMKNFVHLNILFFCLLLSLTRFTFVCIYKSMPTMEDSFISTYLYISTNMISALLTIVMFYCPGKPVLNEVNLDSSIINTDHLLLDCFSAFIAHLYWNLLQPMGCRKRSGQNSYVCYSHLSFGLLNLYQFNLCQKEAATGKFCSSIQSPKAGKNKSWDGISKHTFCNSHYKLRSCLCQVQQVLQIEWREIFKYSIKICFVTFVTDFIEYLDTSPHLNKSLIRIL